jgi:hypothetical protein
VKETSRTLVFVAAAVASVALATAAHYVSKPRPLSGFGEVGTVYYPDFTNPNDANAIKVVAWDETTATPRDFEVRYDHGRWIIPSHHNYPADAKDRLAKTAASVIGVKRGAMASRYEADHEKYGVIDPMNTDVTTLKGRGQRLTLTNNDNVLADFIIGKPVEGEENTYYVRNPREKETYRTALTIDLSTKFADWIEPDLLQTDRNDLKEIVAKKFALGPQGTIVDRESTRLTYDPKTFDWKLDGLNAETEEVKADEVRKIVGNLDDLRIVGVRPKPGGLNADLTIDRTIAKDPLAFTAVDNDLRRRGFVLYPDEKKNLQLASNEGAVFVKSNQGIEYALHFGEIFTGDDKEIEVGGATKDGAEKAGAAETAPETPAEGEAKPADAKSGDEAQKDDAAKSDDEAKKDAAAIGENKDENDKQKRSRYLFVSVHFDPKLIGEPPTKPTEPQKPADGDKKAEEANKPADAAASENTDAKSEEKNEATDKPADETAAEDAKKTESGDKPEEKAGDKAKDAKAEYDAAMAKYNEDLKKYEDDVKQHDKKVEDGRKKFEQLKARFGGWYYVISADSFETLRLSHADLVKPKEKKDDKATPDSSLEIPPSLQPPVTTEPPAANQPAATEPPADDAKPEPTEPAPATPDANQPAPEAKTSETPPVEPAPAENPPADAKEEPAPAEPKTEQK